MKFVMKKVMATVDPHADGLFIVNMENDILFKQRILTLIELKEHFDPADCEALDLVDPDRNMRLCSAIC